MADLKRQYEEVAQHQTSLVSNCNDESNSNSSLRQFNSIVTATSSDLRNLSTTILYDVEHLATFSTSTSSHHHNDNSNNNATTSKLNNRQKLTTTTGGVNSTSQPTQTFVAEPKVALQKLFELEKLSGIWTQQMQIELRDDLMLIVDCETSAVVERFHRDRVTRPEAFNQYNAIHDNIIVFIIQNSNDQKEREQQQQQKQQVENNSEKLPKQVAAAAVGNTIKSNNEDHTRTTSNRLANLQLNEVESSGELHIFQCVSHDAQQLVADILAWKSGDLSSRLQQQNQVGAEQNNDQTGVMSDVSLVSDKHNQIGHNKSTKDERARQAAPVPATTTTTTTSSASNKIDKKKQTQSNSSDTRPSVVVTTGDETSNKSADKTTSNQLATFAETASSKPVVVTVASSNLADSETVPIVNVNVKETVQVFNQIAALREKGANLPNHHQMRTHTVDSTSGTPLQQQVDKTTQQNDTQVANVALSTGGQFYKQRSIRAQLATSTTTNANRATKECNTNGDSSTTQPQHLNGSSTSSSSLTSSSDQNSKSASSSRSAGATSATTTTTKSQSSSAASGQKRLIQSGQHARQQQVTQHTAHHSTTNSSASSSSSNQQQQQYKSNSHHSQQQLLQQQQQTKSGQRASKQQVSRPLAASNGTSAAQMRHHNSIDGMRNSSPTSSQLERQVTTNESYVSVLNHCFDDIEKFIIRLQHAYSAMRDLQAAKRYHSRRSSSGGGGGQLTTNAVPSQMIVKSPPSPPLPLSNRHQPSVGGHSAVGAGVPMSASELALLSARARGPTSDDFFEILSKFKLAFNLLAKLKGCIHEPNAPELVHFLFTPLAIIIESARNVTPPVDPTLVGIPYLNRDALELLSNCCTSKESDLWLSLGPNWTQTIDMDVLGASRLPSSFQPIFSDGWAPVISELELIGLVAPSSVVDRQLLSSSPMQQQLITNKSGRRNQTDAELLNAKSAGRKRNSQLHQNDNTVVDHLTRHYIHDDSTHAQTSSYSSTSNHLDAHSNAPHLTEHPYNGRANEQNELTMLSGAQTHHHRHRSSMGGARHSMPSSDKSSMSSNTKYQRQHYKATNGNSTRRNSEYPNYSHYSSSSMAGFSSPNGCELPTTLPIDHSDMTMSPTHGSSFLTNTSHDYTELQEQQQQQQHIHQAPVLPLHIGGGAHRNHQQHADPYASARAHATRAHMMSPPNGNNLRSKVSSSSQYHRHTTNGNAHYKRNQQHELSEREAMLLDVGPAQTEWFYELQSHGALIVRVLFSREANNEKELTVSRGEILEILDDSRKWWKARNINLCVAYVPHTIVAVMEHYQTLDELLTNTASDMLNDSHHQQHYAHQENVPFHHHNENGHFFRDTNCDFYEDRRNSKAASSGAFRYF